MYYFIFRKTYIRHGENLPVWLKLGVVPDCDVKEEAPKGLAVFAEPSSNDVAEPFSIDCI